MSPDNLMSMLYVRCSGCTVSIVSYPVLYVYSYLYLLLVTILLVVKAGLAEGFLVQSQSSQSCVHGAAVKLRVDVHAFRGVDIEIVSLSQCWRGWCVSAIYFHYIII